MCQQNDEIIRQRVMCFLEQEGYGPKAPSAVKNSAIAATMTITLVGCAFLLGPNLADARIGDSQCFAEHYVGSSILISPHSSSNLLGAHPNRETVDSGFQLLPL